MSNPTETPEENPVRWGDEPPTLTLEQMFAAAALLLAERLEAFEFATPPEAKEACVAQIGDFEKWTEDIVKLLQPLGENGRAIAKAIQASLEEAAPDLRVMMMAVCINHGGPGFIQRGDGEDAWCPGAEGAPIEPLEKALYPWLRFSMKPTSTDEEE